MCIVVHVHFQFSFADSGAAAAPATVARRRENVNLLTPDYQFFVLFFMIISPIAKRGLESTEFLCS